jgi:cell division protein FtsL
MMLRAAGPRPMVRATVGIIASPAPRPSLTVVPRRRRAARLLAFVCVVIVAAMLGAASFQTLLAQRQLELDKLDQEIAAAREGYEVLRQERAELRSPQRLAGIAGAVGMIPAKQNSFVPLSPELMAVVQESVGPLALDGPSGASDDPLDQFRLVKSLTPDAP